MSASAITRVALMAAVTAAAAQIAIPIPPVPFILQVLAVILSGLLLGPRYGALAQAVYVLVGAVGVPVFSEFSGGLGVILGPTGGYLVSYPIAAAVAGLAAPAVAGGVRRRALVLGILWGYAGLAVIYALGATWLRGHHGFTRRDSPRAGCSLLRDLRPDQGRPRDARRGRSRSGHYHLTKGLRAARCTGITWRS